MTGQFPRFQRVEGKEVVIARTVPLLQDEIMFLDPVQIQLKFLQVVGFSDFIESNRIGELAPVPSDRLLLACLDGAHALFLEDEGQMIGKAAFQLFNLFPVYADDLLFQQVVVDLLTDRDDDLTLGERRRIFDGHRGEQAPDEEVPVLVVSCDPVITKFHEALRRQIVTFPTIIRIQLLDELREGEDDFSARLERHVPICQNLCEGLEVFRVEVRDLPVQFLDELLADEDREMVGDPLLIFRDHRIIVLKLEIQLGRFVQFLIQQFRLVLDAVGHAEEWDIDGERRRMMRRRLVEINLFGDLP